MAMGTGNVFHSAFCMEIHSQGFSAIYGKPLVYLRLPLAGVVAFIFLVALCLTEYARGSIAVWDSYYQSL